MNRLYFGDNLAVMKRHVSDESIDLIYLDPPFNSQARYNVLFKSPREDVASAQAAAFLDLWSWGAEAEGAFHTIMTEIGGPTAAIIQALRAALGETDMMAYLVIMAVRLEEMRRVLKPTGALYLHCDPTASHYLKIILDAIFGRGGFLNEIVWKRTTTKNDFQQGAKNWPRIHDTILYFSRDPSRLATFEQPFAAHDQAYVAAKYNKIDPAGRRYMLDNLTAPGAGSRGHPQYELMGVTRYWRYNKDKMLRLVEEGRVVQPSLGAVPRYVRYLDEMRGVALGDIWIDIDAVNSQARERVGYPTQKPLALLERIIKASSREGDVILDPFCGCGTTVEAAEKLHRQWVGIDISIHAVHVIEARMRREFGATAVPKAQGIPADYDSAAQLASDNPFQFQWWANYLLGVHRLTEVKKGADRGVDGEVFFPNGPGRPYGRIITSVKAGKNVSPAMVRELRGTVEREGAEMGLFICLDPPTREMEREAVVAGFAPVVHGRLPRIQIMNIADWFEGRRPALPPREHLPYAAFSNRSNARAKRPDPNAPELPFSFPGGKVEKDVVRHLNPHMVSDDQVARFL